MIVIAFDPGENTGVCTLDTNLKTFACSTVPLEDLTTVNTIMELTHPKALEVFKAQGILLVVEKVVKTGRMNGDKFNQVCAFDRVTQAFDTFLTIAEKQEVKDAFVVEITPEQRKHVKVKMPKGFKTPHERDAFRQAVAGLYLLGMDAYEFTFKPAD